MAMSHGGSQTEELVFNGEGKDLFYEIHHGPDTTLTNAMCMHSNWSIVCANLIRCAAVACSAVVLFKVFLLAANTGLEMLFYTAVGVATSFSSLSRMSADMYIAGAALPQKDFQTRKRSVCPMYALCPVISAAAAYLFVRGDPHWYFINHQLVFLGGILSLQHGLISVAQEIFKHKIRIFFVYLVSCLSSFAVLAGASTLRFVVSSAHEQWKKLVCVGAVMCLVMVLREGWRQVWGSLDKAFQSDDPVEAENLETYLAHGTVQARSRDGQSFFMEFIFGFSNKLMKTALPTWQMALLLSTAENVFEFCSLQYTLGKSLRAHSTIKEKSGSGSLPYANLQNSKPVQDPDPKPAHEVMKCGLLLTNYLSNMSSEVVLMMLAVFAGIVFEDSKEVTGLSNDVWTVEAALSFLCASLLPEVLCDVVGLGFISSKGVDAGRMYWQVHGTMACLIFKLFLTLSLLPFVVVAARVRKWGA